MICFGGLGHLELTRIGQIHVEYVFFPECGAKGSRLTVGVWGPGVFTRCFGLRPREGPMAGPLGNAPRGGLGGRKRGEGGRGRADGNEGGAFGFADLSCLWLETSPKWPNQKMCSLHFCPKFHNSQAAVGLSLATACSGTDSPIVLAKHMGLETSFSCEFDELKRTPDFAQGDYFFIFPNGKSILWRTYREIYVYVYNIYMYIYTHTYTIYMYIYIYVAGTFGVYFVPMHTSM